MAISIAMANAKGGTSKTSSTCIMAYLLATKYKKKVLVCDLDAQGNATDMLLHTSKNITGKNPVFNASLMEAVKNKDLSQALVKIIPNLDLLASTSDFALYPRYMESKVRNYRKRIDYFWSLLTPIIKQNNYDFVFLDVPPTLGFILDSALINANYAIIVMQAQQYGLNGAKTFVDYAQSVLLNEYKAPKLDILGILPVMVDSRSSSDDFVRAEAQKEFGTNNIFDSFVPVMARIKRFSITGLDNKSYYSDQVYDVYSMVIEEMLGRINKELPYQ